MRRIVSMFASLLIVVALGACEDPSLFPHTYGQMLPETFCDAFDFDPLVAAIDVGQPVGDPIFDHSGIENRWYLCSLLTQREEGRDRRHSATVWIKVELFGQVDSAAAAFEEAIAELGAPVDFSAEDVQRAVKDMRADRYYILILDGNLVVHVGAVDGLGESIAPAAGKHVDKLARAALEEVRTSATTA